VTDDKIFNVAVTGLGSGAVTVSGTSNINIIRTSTRAYIGAGAQINQDASYRTANQSVYVLAKGDTYLVTSVGTGGGAGVATVDGAANIGVLSKTTEAFIGEGARVSAQRNSVVSAESSQLLDRDNEPDGSVDGNIDFNIHGEDIQVDGTGLGAKLTETVQGLAVVAVSNQKIITTTIAIAGAGGLGATGASVVNVLAATTEAFIGGGAVGASGSFNIGIISNVTWAHASGSIQAAKDILVMALSDEDLQIHTANASGGGVAGTGAAVSVGILDGETLAYVHKYASLAAYRDILVHAVNDALVVIDSIGADVGGVGGLSGALAVGVVTHITRAYVENAADSTEAADLYAGRTLEVKAESVVESDRCCCERCRGRRGRSSRRHHCQDYRHNNRSLSGRLDFCQSGPAS